MSSAEEGQHAAEQIGESLTPQQRRIEASVPHDISEGEAFLLIALSRLSMQSPPSDQPSPDQLGYEGPAVGYQGLDGYN